MREFAGCCKRWLPAFDPCHKWRTPLGTPYGTPHRHYSHLFAIWPLRALDMTNASQCVAIGVPSLLSLHVCE